MQPETQAHAAANISPIPIRDLRSINAKAVPASKPAVLPLGISSIDARFPEGGLKPALHEIVPDGHQATPAALGFLLALTQRAAARRKGLVFWPMKNGGDDFGRPYAPGLKYFGLDPARFLFARCKTTHDLQWAMEEALRTGGIAAVIGMRPSKTTLTISRRLQLASETTGTPIFLLRQPADAVPSAARTRWRVATRPAREGHVLLPRCAAWLVTLERTRAGSPGTWEMEWDHDALCLRLSSLLAGRTVHAGEEGQGTRYEGAALRDGGRASGRLSPDSAKWRERGAWADTG